MNIETKTTYNLEPLTDYPFEIWLEMTSREQVYWFTPRRKLKINVGRIDTRHLEGKMTDGAYNTILGKMKLSKSDILTNESKDRFYTTGDKTLIELPFIKTLLDIALEEWKIRFGHSGDF